jgi:hypothetical protein
MTTTMPGINQSTADGALAPPARDSSSTCLKVGTSTSGTANQVKGFAGNAASLVVAAYGDGDLPDEIRDHLVRSLGKYTLGVKGSAATAAVAGTLALLSGTGPTVPTLGGTPNEDAQARIKIISTGSETTATYQSSLDGGDTWSATKTASASAVALGNGSTVLFPVGTYTAGAVFGGDQTGPRNSLANVSTALDAGINGAEDWSFCHILGHPATPADLATLAAAVDAKMAAAPLMAKWPFAILEAPPVDPATIVSALASLAAPNVVICGGFAEVYDDADRQIEKKSIARPVAARIARNPISVSLMRNTSDTDIEALTGVRDILPTGATGTDGYNDSFLTPAMNNARLTTLMKWPGFTGFYVANSFTFSPMGSDYLELPNTRIKNRGRQVLYTAAVRHAQRKIPRIAGGFIDPRMAKFIESDMAGQLHTALVQDQHATKVAVSVNRNDNLASDPNLRAKARVQSVTRVGIIDVEFGFAVAL